MGKAKSLAMNGLLIFESNNNVLAGAIGALSLSVTGFDVIEEPSIKL